MAPKSPTQRPARTPRPSLKERLLAALTEPTIGKSRKRAGKERPAASKKQKTKVAVSQAVEEDEEPTAPQSDEAESSTNHDPTSSDEDVEELEKPEEPVPVPEGEYYETDDDLNYDSGLEYQLQEEEQRFSYGFAMHWRIGDAKGKCLRTVVQTTRPRGRLLAPLDFFQHWYQQELKANFCGYRFKGLAFKASYDNGDESGATTFGGDQNAYYATINQLVVWSLRGHRGATLSLTARVKKMPEAAPSQSALHGRMVRVPDLRMRLSICM
jgi:hypothetical protein